jgi:hypothetical protein
VPLPFEVVVWLLLDVVGWLVLEVVVWLLLEVVVLLEVFDAAGFTAGFAVRAGRLFGLDLGGGFGLGLGFSAGGA